MPTVLGVRCWKDRVALVALRGDPHGTPDVVLHRRANLPAGATDGDRARWVHKTVIEAIEESAANSVAVRVSDGDADQQRAEHEGVTLLAAASRGLMASDMRRQSMTSLLSVGRLKGAWAQFPKADQFISGFVVDEREAAMAAQAVLNRGTAF